MTAEHLYVHVPFCARRCSYCAFHIAIRRPPFAERYVNALRRELEIRFPGGLRSPLRSLYFGGGTPSHLGAEALTALIQGVAEFAPLADDCEVTLEANPEDVDSKTADAWLDAGINRVSLGIQSLSDPVLAWMHRVHDASRARAALQTVTARFSRVSADVIFAVPAALPRDLNEELQEIVSSGAGHISIYGLTAEPRTPYARWLERGEVTEAEEEIYVREYLMLHEVLSGAGFEHYEVSSFARKGERSIHNQSYWDGRAYIGLGPAAHGYDETERRWNIPEYEQWARSVERGEDPKAGSEVLTPENRVAEQAYLGLRVVEGVEVRSGEHELLQRWSAAGWGGMSGARYHLTPLGWLRLDSLAYALTAARSR